MVVLVALIGFVAAVLAAAFGVAALATGAGWSIWLLLQWIALGPAMAARAYLREEYA